MIFEYPDGFHEAIKELDITPNDWNELEELLKPKEVETLEVIFVSHSRAEYLLFFREMLGYLDKRGVLPEEYSHFLNQNT